MPLAVVAASERTNASDKQPGAFRTIGEVAEDLDVPQHVLRFWESRFAQIRPLKRGGNRRYYRPDDVDLLRGVRQLLHGQGYTIRGAQRVLKQNGVRFVQAVGRGDALAGPPAPAEREPTHDGSEDAAQASLSQSERTALQAALDELRACRAILAGLAPDRLDLT